jgi:hypothetical protein
MGFAAVASVRPPMQTTTRETVMGFQPLQGPSVEDTCGIMGYLQLAAAAAVTQH